MSADKLTARWSKRERDVVFSYPRSCDGHMLYGIFAGLYRNESNEGRSPLKELERRGYDLTTLRVSIDRKPPPAPAKEKEADG